MKADVIAEALQFLSQGHSVLDDWDNLRQEVNRSLLRVTNYPPADRSVISQCPEGDTGTYARDTGVMEVFAGSSRLMLDREGNGALLVPQNLVFLANEIRLMSEVIQLGPGNLNPALMTTEDTLVTPGPLFPSAVTEGAEESGTLMFVMGLPAPGSAQYSLPVTSLLSSISLLTEVTDKPDPDNWLNKAMEQL